MPDRRQLRLGTPERNTVGEPAEHVDRRATAARVIGRIQAQRDPVAVGERESEALRHDADDGVRRRAESNRSPDDVRITVEATLPLLVCDHQHRGGAFALVILREVSPLDRQHAGDTEAGRAHLGDAYQRGTIVRDQIAAARTERAEVLHGLELLAPHHEVVQRPPLRIAGLVGAVVLDRDDAIALIERKRRVQHRVDDGEGARADRDRDRHADHAHERKAGILREHAQPQLHIEQRHVQENAAVPRAAFAREHARALVAYTVEVTEALARGASCGLGIHAARDVVTNAFLDMMVEFIVHVVGGVPPEDPAPAPPRSVPHHSSRRASVGWIARPRRAGPSAASRPTVMISDATIGRMM